MRNLRELDRYRDHQFEKLIRGKSPDEKTMELSGCFWIPTKGVRRGLKVIASSGLIPESQGFDHVSVSLPTRCPAWEEMDRIKRLFFEPHEVAFQLHPEESDHISNHRFCLHLWNNLHQPIPLPPPGMVGNSAPVNIGRSTRIWLCRWISRRFWRNSNSMDPQSSGTPGWNY